MLLKFSVWMVIGAQSFCRRQHLAAFFPINETKIIHFYLGPVLPSKCVATCNRALLQLHIFTATVKQFYFNSLSQAIKGSGRGGDDGCEREKTRVLNVCNLGFKDAWIWKVIAICRKERWLENPIKMLGAIIGDFFLIFVEGFQRTKPTKLAQITTAVIVAAWSTGHHFWLVIETFWVRSPHVYNSKEPDV